jgi:RNA polymerase sigma-70 factor (ECF subfamily)
MADERVLSDAALLDGYLSGSRTAAAAIFARYGRPLRVFLLRRLRDEDLAEEALQETFCRLLERARQLVDHPRLQAWLFSVARNVSADILRCRRQRSARESGLPGNLESRALDPVQDRPETGLRSREFSELVLRAMRRMPEAERRVFLLRTQSTLSFREIALRLDAPINTVLSRMHRALKRIRGVLVQEGWLERPGAESSPRPGASRPRRSTGDE